MILALEKHLVWARQNGNSWSKLYYYDEYTWIVGALVLAWLIWILVRRYMRIRRQRRPARRTDQKLLNRAVKVKRELSSNYLPLGFSTNIHAIGVGMLGGEYCVQVFVNDANEEMWTGSGTATVPDTYKGIPVMLIEMAPAGFLSVSSSIQQLARDQYPNGIRDNQDVIVGGISGANTNLTGASGTIGYFCTRKSRFRRRKDVHLLSNSHVFADLKKASVDDGDLIMQPSPGESSSNRPIGTLINFCPLKFDGDIKDPNYVDAAIAKLWAPQKHKALIPLVGAVKGFVEKSNVEVGEVVRKFGRTTGYTEGHVYSIYLDLWIKYDRTGQSAFFQDQVLIEPSLPTFQKFVSKGDSGALVVDSEQHAVGLVFAGMTEVPESVRLNSEPKSQIESNPATITPLRIENYGVANPISEVLDRLKIELLV